MEYQWYPGHMTKARRAMQEDIKLIDVIIELTDARAPLSGRNPDIDELGRNKSRVLLLNKADLADEQATEEWSEYFKEKGFFVLTMDSREKKKMSAVTKAVQSACREKIERDRSRGIKNRPVRAMVAGIPNVGKSTFINSFAGRACAKTGNTPGVTRGKQWIRLNRELELLDTPGILWPKFEDQAVGMRLAMIGSIRDDVLNREELSLELIDFLKREYPDALKERYGCGQDGMPVEILEEIAKSRGCLRRGNEPDYAKAASLLLDDLRSGRLGRITLERPSECAAK